MNDKLFEALGITPGPWRTFLHNGNYMISGGDKSKKQCFPVIILTSGYDHNQPTEEDSKLMAAAPEMLVRDIKFVKAIEQFMAGCKIANDTGSFHTAKIILEMFDFTPDEKATGKTRHEIKELVND